MGSSYTDRYERTHVRRVTEGLWPMVAEPGPNFRWGVVLRKSKLKRTMNQYGEIELVAESLDTMSLRLFPTSETTTWALLLRRTRTLPLEWNPKAKRPRYKHALVDLSSGWIDGIAVLAIDRLTRRTDQVRPILNALEEMGGGCLRCGTNLTRPTTTPSTTQSFVCTSWWSEQSGKQGEHLSATRCLPSIALARGFTTLETSDPMGTRGTAAVLWMKRRKCCSRQRRQLTRARQCGPLSRSGHGGESPLSGEGTTGTPKCSEGFSLARAWWASGSTRGLSSTLSTCHPSFPKNSGGGSGGGCWRIPPRGGQGNHES